MKQPTEEFQMQAAVGASLNITPQAASSAKGVALKRSLSIGLLVIATTLTHTAQAASSANASAGRWDLTLISPKGGVPSWIEVSEDQGQMKLVMVGIGEHATPLKNLEIKGGAIQFVSPNDEEGFAHEMLFKGKIVGQRLEGTITDSAEDAWNWKGVRTPKLDRPGPPNWGQPIKQFSGTGLSRWHMNDKSMAGTWKVENGMLISTGFGSELISNTSFEDCKLHVEFKSGPTSNSGIYLRGRYEVQIETDSAAEPNSHHTGGVYGFIAPTPEQPRKPGVWQTLDITLLGRKVTIVQNGITIIDIREIPGISGDALDSHEGLPGPIYLQGSEQGTVSFKNIVITPVRNSVSDCFLAFLGE